MFNRQGYVGASLRDLIDATGLEKGGIYNHFGSKEQLALEAYDYAMTLVTERPGPLAGRRDRRDPTACRRMIRAFATARPQPGDRGRLPDHEHRDRGRRHPPGAARPRPRSR